ncbi:MAG TPA: sigma-70 family RNA polymerase sigma factor [Solirubrobacteraceae bacterium]|nr:sigma-70 family RNA polymerase sigma factor [Solirubrobacteraceae bacterium]
MSEPDDARLVLAAQTGDVAALGTLLERHRALLHAVAVGMLGPGGRAEDAVQDTFVIAMRRLDGLRDPAAARGWLLAVLRNVCLAELRRPELAPATEPTAAAVDEAIDRLALSEWVWTALERLSEPLRTPLVLRYFSNASSYDAIADICGVPVGTVRSRLNAARGKLADELLATAALAHTDRREQERIAAQHSAAMQAFERTGDGALLVDVMAPDVRFVLSDRVPRQGRDLYASLLTGDFEDGVTTRLQRVITGADLAIVELWLDSPPDDPLHCPPAVTQVHSHDHGVSRRIVSHYSSVAPSNSANAAP